MPHQFVQSGIPVCRCTGLKHVNKFSCLFELVSLRLFRLLANSTWGVQTPELCSTRKTEQRRCLAFLPSSRPPTKKY